MSLVKKWFVVVLVAGWASFGLSLNTVARAEDEAKKPAAADESAKTDKAEADPFVVPDGTAAELSQQIGRLMRLRPTGDTPKERAEFFNKQVKAVLVAADKLLAAKDAKPMQLKMAAQLKMQALGMLAGRGDKEAIEAIGKLPEQLKELGLPELAARAELVRFRIEFSKALAGAPGAPTVEQMIETIKEKVKGKANAASAALVSMAITGVQQKQSVEKALTLCDEFAKMFADDQSKDAVRMVRRIKGMARRMQLMGNPMEISGTLLDGKPLDWSAYKGKVVLVQFWATWCGPCRGEIPNVRKYYDLYHDKGFEVVSISLDRSREPLAKYVDENKLPWPVVFEDGEENVFWNAPMAIDYAVSGIPALFLLDKEGKVVSERARGAVLGKELEKLLGPAEEPKEKEEAGKDEKAEEKL